MHKSLIRREKKMPEIPMASTADIAFLLILFFMVTTVIRTTTGLKIERPTAKSTKRIRIRRNIAHVFIDFSGQVMIDDVLVPTDLVSNKMYEKVVDNPELITIMDVDKKTNYGAVDDVMEELKEAKAFRITFATDRLEEGG